MISFLRDEIHIHAINQNAGKSKIGKNQVIELANQVNFKSNMTKLSIGRRVMFYDTQQLTEAEI